MRDVAATAFTMLEFSACLVACTPPMGLMHLLDKGDPTQRRAGRWMRRLGRLSSSLTPLWRFHVEGQPPADVKTRPYVCVSNHESNADPFLLSHLPWDMRWVAKRELYKMPLVGITFRVSGDIPLTRGDGDSVRAMFAECRRALDAGISVMIFPEGTRSKTGELLPFRDGAFKLAIEAGVPILPMAIAGTRNCLLREAPYLGRADAVVKVLSPIPTTGLGPEDLAALRDKTRQTISAALKPLRAQVGATLFESTPA
ncbi:MAG: 1-acyl-sn-glycerol-3-phosphate acyltransferase [Polyangiaceae bacterium]|jgi:1-acyl-sn-glycerol-3-phosphate acyltransferase|nr:1-acyl-sn-glycerol-3-phosphate acyltransferase [Polyangiaceae bacterium]MBK8942651.1 1-acyl-sn-glycerol-3-phosphate acyltransferase [Polyangiaceae bacterium]